MDKEEKINCHNCSHFMHHYIIDKHCRLAKVLDCGHCISNSYRRTHFDKPCKHWQPREVLAQEQKKYVKGTLENIEILLEKIAIALENVEDF
ncbi:MAG: hypothetical protein HDT29_04515 [Clostridiales bacterium]|nr:hypothetical protein [Clostridiales bacterium]